tara:strand:- start:149 stop:484 length:336 start_codon:yes stop_codon:yes gene_type:complete
MNKINKNKMVKQNLQERFQKLAGIKAITLLKEEEITEQFMDTMESDPLLKEEIFTVLAGLAGLIGTAGVTGQIQSAMEDPAIAEKYPALAQIFGFLTKMGGAVGPGIGKGV